MGQCFVSFASACPFSDCGLVQNLVSYRFSGSAAYTTQIKARWSFLYLAQAVRAKVCGLGLTQACPPLHGYHQCQVNGQALHTSRRHHLQAVLTAPIQLQSISLFWHPWDFNNAFQIPLCVYPVKKQQEFWEYLICFMVWCNVIFVHLPFQLNTFLTIFLLNKSISTILYLSYINTLYKYSQNILLMPCYLIKFMEFQNFVYSHNFTHIYNYLLKINCQITSWKHFNIKTQF